MNPPDPHQRSRWPILVAAVVGLAAGIALQRFWGLPAYLLLVPPMIGTAVGFAVHRMPRGADRLARWVSRRNLAWPVGVAATAYLGFTAWSTKRVLTPTWHDEFSYLIQARIFAAGGLWMPGHPHHRFFDSFHLIVDPKYLSKYPPGASLLLAVAAVFDFPHAWVVLALTGVVAGLLYAVVARMYGRRLALLTVFVLVGSGTFRLFSTMAMSQVPILLALLAAVLFYLRWRERPGPWPAAGMGACLGFAAITRPMDAAMLGVGLLIAAACDARPAAVGPRRVLTAAAIALLSAAPFAGLQAVTNIGVTGSPWTMPYQIYEEKLHYNPSFFRGMPADAPPPVFNLPQQRTFHRDFLEPMNRERGFADWIESMATSRLPRVARVLLNTDPLLVTIAVMGVVGLGRRSRWLLPLMFPLFVATYGTRAGFRSQYILVLLPATAVLVAGGVEAISHFTGRHRRAVAAGAAAAVVAGAALYWPQFNRDASDQFFAPTAYGIIDRTFAELEHRPALVFIRADETSNPHVELVYNIDAAYPDEAAVIRAHDLGPDNVELLDYYARRQPQRHVYHLDRGSGALRYWGPIRDVLRRQREAGDAARPGAPP